MWMSFHRSPGHTRMVEMVWPDTILNLAEASERLGNTWQVSKQQPWVWPVGEWGVGISSCHMGKKSAVGKRLLNSFKGFLCLPAGCIFCPLFCFVFSWWYSLETKPQAWMLCHPASASQMLGLWASVSRSGSSGSFHSFPAFAKPRWDSFLETLALISLLLLVSCLISDMIFLQVCQAPQVKKPHSRQKSCWSLSSESFKHQDPEPQQAWAWAGLS